MTITLSSSTSSASQKYYINDYINDFDVVDVLVCVCECVCV